MKRKRTETNPVKVFKSSVVQLIIRIIIVALLCVTGTFLAAGTIQVYLLHNNNPIIVLIVITMAVDFSTVIVVKRGIIRVEVGEESIVFKRWNRITGTYLFEDYLMTADEMSHVVLSSS